jgi:hypothetical protein
MSANYDKMVTVSNILSDGGTFADALRFAAAFETVAALDLEPASVDFSRSSTSDVTVAPTRCAA